MSTDLAARVVAPFEIEAKHPRNCDLAIQCVPGLKLRSAVSQTTKTVQGGVRTPTLDNKSPPKLPGMRLFVDPENLIYRVSDPLRDDESLRDSIGRWIKETTGSRSESRPNGVPTKNGELDEHKAKSLCREMYNLLKEGEAVITDGLMPELDDIEDLPGKFLLNPGLRTHTTQPRFEEDWDAWLTQLTKAGG